MTSTDRQGPELVSDAAEHWPPDSVDAATTDPGEVIVFDRTTHLIIPEESPGDGSGPRPVADHGGDRPSVLGARRSLFELFSDEARPDLEAAILRAEVTSAARASVRSRFGRSLLVTIIDCGLTTTRALAVIHEARLSHDHRIEPTAIRIRFTRAGRFVSSPGPVGVISRIAGSTSFGHELFDADERVRYAAAVERVATGEPYERLTMRGCAPELWFEVIIAASGDEIIVDLIDRSDRQQTTHSLIRSQQQFNQLSATLPVGVFSVSTAGRLTYHSDRLREMFGPTIAEEFDWIESVHPDDRRLLAEAMASMPAATGFSTEVRGVRADGSIGWFRVSGSAVVGHDQGLEGAVGFVEDVSERHDLRERIEFQAAFDTLTELPNRATLIERLRSSLAAEDGTWHTAVLFIDLDGFKLVNDTQGHKVGDQVLVEVARRFQRAVRTADIIGRFGGDEFLVVASGMTDVAQADLLAVRIHDALSTPIFVDALAITIQASIGIAVSEGDTTSEQLIGDADIAMYEAKGSGRSRTVVFDAPLRARASERFDMTADLRHARRRRELRLDYQPIIDLRTNRLVGAEGLLRWDHPTMGRIEPAMFVPLAEEIGLIADVGEWVVGQACADFERLRACDAIDDTFVISVNTSAHQFSDAEALATSSLAALNRYGVAPGNIRFELTESVPITQVPDVAARIRKLTDRGFGLAIDDFGTGYSSLGYLTTLPFDVLKLDLSLIAQIEAGSPALAVVESLTRMSDEMSFAIVAEGIETARQQELLHASGVQFGQGFHISRPLDLAGLQQLIEQG